MKEKEGALFGAPVGVLLALSLTVALAFLLAACGGGGADGGGGGGGGGRDDGDGDPAADQQRSAVPGGRGDAATPAGVEPCALEVLNPDRMALSAEWHGGHVRILGTVRDGAGQALSLALSQNQSFVYDEIFRSEVLSVLTLESDEVDATSVTFEPNRSQLASFQRTGARPLDPALPLCVDASLYEKGSLDLLATRHFLVRGAAPTSRDGG
ncbi:MAG: hypothetical protein H0V09_04365 [Gemmatimonadetes bacterium]|nr:hypothetical protein [Gemmatimonadota bacterium]